MPFVRSQSSCENPEGALRDQCLLIASQMMSSIALSTFCHLMGASRGDVPWFSNAQLNHRKEGRDCDRLLGVQVATRQKR